MFLNHIVWQSWVGRMKNGFERKEKETKYEKQKKLIVKL
jgi:hypothetical protein